MLKYASMDDQVSNKLYQLVESTKSINEVAIEAQKEYKVRMHDSLRKRTDELEELHNILFGTKM